MSEGLSVCSLRGFSPAFSNNSYTRSRRTSSSEPKGQASTLPQASLAKTSVLICSDTKLFNNSLKLCNTGVCGSCLLSMGHLPGEQSHAPSCTSLSCMPRLTHNGFPMPLQPTPLGS